MRFAARWGMPFTRPSALDSPALRPAVPKEAEPRAWGEAGEDEPPAQPGAEEHLRREGLDHPTPVVGTAQPPRGLSGALRRRAYGIPERRARHWMLLLLADRVDVLEDRVGSFLAAPLEGLGVHGAASWTRRNPLVALGGLLTVGVVARRSLRRDGDDARDGG